MNNMLTDQKSEAPEHKSQKRLSMAIFAPVVPATFVLLYFSVAGYVQ